MKIRIIGTSSMTATKKYQEITKYNSIWFIYEKIGNNYVLKDENKNQLIFFSDNNATMRQYIEVWQAFGLISHKNNKYYLNSSSDFNEIIKIAKCALILPSYDKKISITRNSKLLIIENLTGNIKENDLISWDIFQTRGYITREKLSKEASKFEIEISKDRKFIVKLRRALYEQIDQEL